MIRNLSDPVFAAVFEAQAKNNILQAGYIQQNIQEAINTAKAFSLNSKISVKPIFSSDGRNTYVLVRTQFCCISSDRLFALADVSTISIADFSTYDGHIIYNWPGVKLDMPVFAVLTAEEKQLLRDLGHVQTQDFGTFYTVVCGT